MGVFDQSDAAVFMQDAKTAIVAGREVQVHLNFPEAVQTFGTQSLGGVVTAAISMEYATADLPDLAHDQVVVIDGVTYKVRHARQVDEHYSEAALRKG